MRFLFLNQYFPPDPAPTGLLLDEWARRLEAAGHTVDRVDAQSSYRGSQQSGGRMRRELAALRRMLLAALRRPRADVIVSGTSPPCLLVVATIAALWHRARSVHWAMDLYPDLAVALGEVPRGFLSALVSRAMRWGYRRADRVLALDEDMVLRLRAHGIEPEIVRPWVVAPVLEILRTALATVAPHEEPWTWIYSGNLGRAHEWATLLEAQALIEQRDSAVRLLFQGGGPAWSAAQARARELGLQRCEWRDYAEEATLPATLLRSAACAVTQRPEAQGLLWPSKLALLLALPRPIAWIGPVDGAVARLLRERAGRGIFTPGQARELAEWVLALRRAPVPVAPTDAAQHREEALATAVSAATEPLQPRRLSEAR